MTEKQYKLEKWTSSSLYYSFPDGNLHHSIGEVIARVENDLNSLYNENEQLKSKNRGLQSELQIFKEDVTHSNLQINKLAEENEQLKTIRSDLICELDIVQNELNIAIDKGFAPTTPYKNYMASKKTEYDKFWENKIKTHNNRLNGVRE